jgi:hypothetical protein
MIFFLSFFVILVKISTEKKTTKDVGLHFRNEVAVSRGDRSE